MKVRTRIFLVFALVIGGGVYFLVQWISDDLRPRYLESLEEPLVDFANILAELLSDAVVTDDVVNQELTEKFEDVYARRFKARIFELERDRVDMRVYVTDRNGVVVFDSDGGRDEGTDYSQWNDVKRTLSGEYGARSTQNDPLFPEGSVAYIAAPIMVEGEIFGVVSVGKPKRNIDQFAHAARMELIQTGIIAAVAAIAIGLVLYAWVSLPLKKLVHYTTAIKHGERAALPSLGNNEIGEVGAAIDEMRSALEGKDYVERYIQTLTHELKSPLAAVRGAAELLAEDMPLDQRQRFASSIKVETERMQDTVDRMLELAALENRQGLQDVELINLGDLVTEIAESLHSVATQHGVKLRNEVASDTVVYGERYLIRQAILNLVRNAVEFSPPNETVLLTSRPWGDGVELRIVDKGQGIPEYAMNKVFDRFYSHRRGDSMTKGTGLGLNLVKEVAELHGGEVGLESAENQGTTAVLRLHSRS